MEIFTIQRVGIPNLDFTGELIGKSSDANPSVRIYRTQAGHYVGQLVGQGQRSNAMNQDTPDKMIEWFKKEAGGQIAPLVQVAIEDAISKDEGFKKAWNIHVE